MRKLDIATECTLFAVSDDIPNSQKKEIGIKNKYNSILGTGESLDGKEVTVRAIPTGEKRTPKEGEWYLSGSIPQAYIAKKNLSNPFMIVRIKTFVRVKLGF